MNPYVSNPQVKKNNMLIFEVPRVPFTVHPISFSFIRNLETVPFPFFFLLYNFTIILSLNSMYFLLFFMLFKNYIN